MAATRRVLLSAIFGIAALGSVGVSFGEEKVVKLGVLAPLTGGAAADGEEMVRGLTLAAEEANAKGGVAGYKFEVVQADTRNQQSDAVARSLSR
jgi:branched-chain amino acid transport system substrate-binding protein